MQPDDEPLLDKYICRPGSLSDEEREEAERLTERDVGAARFAEHLREFYVLLEEEKSRETSWEVNRFVDDLSGQKGGPGRKNVSRKGGTTSGTTPASDRPPSTIEARPFEPRRESGPTVLAAATKTARSNADRQEAASGGFETFTTLVSEGGEVLVRVLGNRETRQGRAYVLSEDPERKAWAIISLPELGLDLVAGGNGIATFDLPEEVSPSEWAEATALVRRPVAEARLQPGEEAILRSFGEENKATVEREGLHCLFDEGRLVAELEESRLTFLAAWSVGGHSAAKDSGPWLLPLGREETTCEVPVDGPLLLRTYE